MKEYCMPPTVGFCTFLNFVRSCSCLELTLLLTFVCVYSHLSSILLVDVVS